MLLDVLVDQSLEQAALDGIQVAPRDKVVGQAVGLFQGPGLEGGDQLGLVDQADLKGEQSEQQILLGGDGGHGSGLQ
jgi:hypothetical protein